MKKLIFTASILLFFAGNFNAFAVQKSKTFGGKEGWSNLSETSNIEIGKGRFGFDSLEISTNKSRVTSSTDLLLSFDNNHIADETGNYKIIENYLIETPKSVMGNGAALSSGQGALLKLEATEKGLFGRRGMTGSFAIEFWMAPATGEDGETIFAWKSSKNSADYAEYQMIYAAITNNHLEWSFSDIFYGYKERDVVLKGRRAIVPGVWSRHSISFDEETGLLEYMVDGHTEDLMFITDTGHEGGTVNQGYLGVAASIEICGNYTGRIDDFRIEKDISKVKDFGLYGTGMETYALGGGHFSTEPVMIAGGATLNSVNAVMSVPSETDVRLYVRSGENYHNWTSTYPEWKEIANGEELKGVDGMYFQVGARLFCDGSGKVSPSVTEITLNYTEDPLPLPPFTVYAEAGEGEITVNWNYSVDENTAGYYVYYGNRSGEYLGRKAVEGISPLKAGNTTSLKLTGLESGSLYYFAVASYSKKDGKTTGNLSKEVFARVK